jgi:hypothetical protein
MLHDLVLQLLLEFVGLSGKDFMVLCVEKPGLPHLQPASTGNEQSPMTYFLTSISTRL